MGDDNLIPLFPGTDDVPVLTQEGAGKERTSYCSHRGVELDTEARRVYCRDCGREVPAFDYLHDLARGYERYQIARDHAEREARLAEARVNELKRQERNAKARLRRGGIEIDRRAVLNAEQQAHVRAFEERKARPHSA